jgi:hypothetical protein
MLCAELLSTIQIPGRAYAVQVMSLPVVVNHGTQYSPHSKSTTASNEISDVMYLYTGETA